VTVLTAKPPQITSVNFVGLDNLTLPFRSHFFDALPGFDEQFPQLLAENEDKYYVKSVDGLGPPPQNVAIARSASGGVFQGKTSEDREVVVLIGLNPDWDAGETPKMLRDELYTMLSTGYDPRVDIQLYAGVFPLCHEYAYVSNFEASIFDANPAVQITFTCLNPTFRAYSPVGYDPADLSETAPDIYNLGTAETGFQFGVNFTGTMNGWYIKQADHQAVGMEFDMVFHSGDLLTVSTIPGQKYIHVKPHRKKVQNKLGILKETSEWIQLHPGHNHFLVPPKTTLWNWSGKLSFTHHYWGA